MADRMRVTSLIGGTTRLERRGGTPPQTPRVGRGLSSAPARRNPLGQVFRLPRSGFVGVRRHRRGRSLTVGCLAAVGAVSVRNWGSGHDIHGNRGSQGGRFEEAGDRSAIATASASSVSGGSTNRSNAAPNSG